jgi:SAM-dependent methyltransferase
MAETPALTSDTLITPEMQAEFRSGFYPDRPAAWIERMANNPEPVEADVAGCLVALDAGQRDFAYPRHDAQVFDLLHDLVPSRRLRKGADIGCATGCFPAMQLAAGVESCTVYEVRETVANDHRISVRVQDLTYAEDVEPEFDLVTCLSTIEHVGLGRYGDPLDPQGDLTMTANLRRLLRPGGIMLLSFPVGRGTVVYNMHRIYSPHRRGLLFGDLELIGHRSGRSWLGQFKHRVNVALGRSGAMSQPIYVLQKSG